MVSSVEPGPANAAVAELGRCLTGTEARGLADRVDASESLTAALHAVDQGRRPAVRELIVRAGLASDRAALSLVCRGIEGARSIATRIDPLWTMPGLLAQTGPLTSSIPQLVADARTSIVCSTYNFQTSSGLWTVLRDAAQQPQVSVRAFIDTAAAEPTGHWVPPSPAVIAAHLRPGQVFRTKNVNGKLVRNHAKYLVVDHRFVLVTSANFSRSAEFANIEFGVRIDSANLAEAIERELGAVQSKLYERVIVR